MKKWKFVSLEEGFEPVLVDSFMEAWDAMYQYVKRLMEAGQMSYQVLETSIWIEQAGFPRLPIFFYDARDRALDEGWTPPKN
jgi:hypothetical protein